MTLLEKVSVSAANPLFGGDFETMMVRSEEFVEFSYNTRGTVHTANMKVVVNGDRTMKHSFVTFHDVGLNSTSNFATLMNHDAMEPITSQYCVYHINAPGQHDNANELGYGFVYPTMENISDVIPTVMSHFGLKSAVFLGDGAGANIFMRFALKNPSMVEGLILVNPTLSYVGNFAWFGEKISNINTPFIDQVMNYHLTKAELEMNRTLLDTHRRHFKQFMNEQNVRTFFGEYERRDEIGLERSVDPQLIDRLTLRCQTLILVGDLSPFVDDAVEVNSRLNPQKTTFLKMADAGSMILEERIFNVAEAVIYFLQGMGHIPSVMMTRLARSRTLSGDECQLRKMSQSSTGKARQTTEVKVKVQNVTRYEKIAETQVASGEKIAESQVASGEKVAESEVASGEKVAELQVARGEKSAESQVTGMELNAEQVASIGGSAESQVAGGEKITESQVASIVERGTVLQGACSEKSTQSGVSIIEGSAESLAASGKIGDAKQTLEAAGETIVANGEAVVAAGETTLEGDETPIPSIEAAGLPNSDSRASVEVALMDNAGGCGEQGFTSKPTTEVEAMEVDEIATSV